MSESHDESLTEGEVALMDATKTIIEVLLASGVATPNAFDQMLGHQRDAYLTKRMGKAAGIVEMLRRFSTDPQRAASREQTRQLLREPPEGSA